MATIRIPPVLRPFTEGQTEVACEGERLGEVLERLFQRYPALRERLLTESGALQRFVNVYVDDEDARTRGELEAPLRADTSVIILPAMAGGARP